MRVPNGYNPLPGSERPQVPGSVLIGPVDAAEKVALTIRVRPRPEAPADHDLDHWQKTPPGKRQFLSADEYMRTYGSAGKDVDAIVDFLKSKGLHVIESDAGRRRIVVEGTAAKVNAAFAITLNTYKAPRRYIPRPGPRRDKDEKEAERPVIKEHIHRGFEGPVNLPSELIGVVAAVIGLDNRQVGGPAATGTGDPPNSNYLSPPAVAQLYNFPNTGAVGATVGIFEDANSGAAYLHSDITSFIASLPAGYNTPPVLTDIGLMGYSNNPALVTSSPSGAVGECCIDVSIAAAVAQGANINVYFTENSEAGWEAFLNRATFPLAGDNPPSVLTASWLLEVQDDAGTIGNPSTSGSIANVLSGLLQTAAMRGITVFMAIGDWGSANQVLDGQCHVSYPNADPWSTACGGTIVGNITAPPTRFEEFVWSDANQFASPFQGFPFVATGGGVSDNFPVPAYQTAAGVLPISKNDGNPRRGVPDVAGMIAMDGFFFAGVGGPGQYGFIGTSLVAPLYAGLVAVIVKWLGRDVGFLNPTFYTYGPEICHDVRFGDNESGNPSPDAPVYIAGPGWDACTGWGSIEGFRLLAALAPAPIIVTAIAHAGNFGNVCLHSFADEILTINNTGFSLLLVTDITSSSPDFQTPAVASYPLAIEPGGSMDVVIRFRPSSLGAHAATLTIFSNDLLGHRLVGRPHKVAVSGTTAAPRLILSIADHGRFNDVCVGKFVDEPLLLSNGGRCPLSVTGITSSSTDFLVPVVLSYPITIGPGDSTALPVRFEPGSLGAKAATLTVTSDDPASPSVIRVSGDAPAPRLVAVIADNGAFSRTCVGSFTDEPLILNNSGRCMLFVTSITSSSAEFLVPKVLSYPIAIGPGDSLPLPIRFEPTSIGLHSATLTIASNDPSSPLSIAVNGEAPTGRLVVTGSTCFGGVKACCSAERTIALCNVGDCKLHVSSVAFRRKNPHWKLINNPFPASLHPGSCLSVVIRYRAAEKCPRSCDLIIRSDDPKTPVKLLEVLAHTVWPPECCCKDGCDDCKKGCCEKQRCDPCCNDCDDCDDCDDYGDEKDCGEEEAREFKD
ncbi:MAG: choice-of-anchor D domain-containing protein [Rhodoferax sp.]|nr:choice-of-anchor D domain-containing protein [Rhodoferax sp.]